MPVSQGSESTFRSIVNAPSPSERLWEFIATIPFLRDARHPSRQSGLTKWFVVRVETCLARTFGTRSVWAQTKKRDHENGRRMIMRTILNESDRAAIDSRVRSLS